MQSSLFNRLAQGYRVVAILFLNTFLLGLACEGVSYLLIQGLDAQNRMEFLKNQLKTDYYSAQPWAELYWQDEVAVQEAYRPFVIWRTAPMHTETIQVDQAGHRVTPGAECTAESFTVFTFGGSTMWGHGVPDWGTIPAYLQQELAAIKEEPVCVVNFGERAYISTQGVLELTIQLQQNHVPDLVIFYDGYNDIASVYQNGLMPGHLEMPTIRQKFEHEYAFRDGLNTFSTYQLGERIIARAYKAGFLSQPVVSSTNEATVNDLAQYVIQTYQGNYQLVAALAEVYGFEYHFFWQPTADTSHVTEAQKPGRSSAEADPITAFRETVYAQIGEPFSPDAHFHNFSGILQGRADIFWIDVVHLGAEGNAVIAEEMVKVILNYQ